MRCPYCEKEIPVVLFDETPGAVFVIKDSSNNYSNVWLAKWGIKKYPGCVIFGRGVKNYSLYYDENFLTLSDKECDNIYFDHPKKGEAWLVKPTKDGYDWERIDDKIAFSDEED